RRREPPNTDLCHVGILPVVAPRRTLLDLCASTRKSQAEIALDAALRQDLVSFEELETMLGYATEHRLTGAALFRELLSVRGEEEAMSESELESAFIRVMRRASFPSPSRQVGVEWDQCHRLDFVFPDHGLIVEVDGRKWHASRQRFADDRRRDNAATLRDLRVVRLTWEDVTRDEPYVVDTIGRALGIIPLFR
ncbi:MAG: endonuclease domain-containing protein, partial [Actinomycetota bacterium]